MNRKAFIEVWDIVEKKMDCTVPTYFKNALKACGYENAITIASIDDEDIQHFESEVRNGNVTKYYVGTAVLNILEGSIKTEANFEFTRGHKKFLIMISDYLKSYLTQNASDSVILETGEKLEDEFKTTSPGARYIQVVANEKKIDSVNFQEIFLHRCMLTCKVIMNLIRIAPTMFAVNFESINQNELVKVEVKDANLSILEADIHCPFCSKLITVLHEPSDDCKFMWNISTFNAHLETEHLEPSKLIELNESIISQVDEDHFPMLEVEQTDNRGACSKKCVMCDSKPIVEDVRDGSYLHILKSPHAINSELGKSSSPENSTSNSIHFENISNNSFEIDKQNMSDTIKPKAGNYVVCSLLVKDATKWPSNANVRKHFVGRICQLEELSKNDDCIDKNETFDIQFLTKHRHSNFIFYCPGQIQTGRISASKIVKILRDPINNRRGGLVFKDKADKATLESFF